MERGVGLAGRGGVGVVEELWVGFQDAADEEGVGGVNRAAESSAGWQPEL